MKIKTADATNLQLDWLVAKSEGHLDDHNTWLHKATLQEVEDGSYHPSTNWAQGGPIIERENIGTGRPFYGCTTWFGRVTTLENDTVCYGPTPLIAAMRCYCVAKLGDEVEVEVPEELK